MEADLEASVDSDVLSDETDSSLSLMTEASSDSLSQQLVQKKNTTSQVWPGPLRGGLGPWGKCVGALAMKGMLPSVSEASRKIFRG